MVRDALQEALDRLVAGCRNGENTFPLILEAVAVADPGNRYLVPYMWFTIGVAIN